MSVNESFFPQFIKFIGSLTILILAFRFQIEQLHHVSIYPALGREQDLSVNEQAEDP